ncbi:unnamed protein product [Periconia digitata]|uniref:Uncharacterized protein n=1 Tax=Periconia digitata TaxID=1303443 RepID=A0A9W4XNZ3_9PLEO|nr:unnamed protein product [Periconia digitata]
MSTKNRWPSWSLRSPPETYHRVGGLLPIDTMLADDDERPAKTVPTSPTKRTSERGHGQRPSLTIITPDYKNQCLNYQGAAFSPQSFDAVHAASNLLALFNDKLRSPITSPTVYPRSSALLDKPLPSQPRSQSLPSTPEPVELPGSILLENQGFPSPPLATGWATSRTMRSVRSVNSVGPTARPGPPNRPRHMKSLSETTVQPERLKMHSNPVTPSSSTGRSTDSKLPTCSESTIEDYNSSSDTVKAHVGLDALLRPSPLMIGGKGRRMSGEGASGNDRFRRGSSNPQDSPARTKQIEELKSTITAQDQTISTLQAQFASLRGSHEAHVASLVDAHSAETSSLRNYTRALEEQQKQRTLHHTSSNHLLFLLDTTDPPAVPEAFSRASTSSASTNSNRRQSFETAIESQARAPSLRSASDSSEMDRFKRKLSTTRRTTIASRNISRESSTQDPRPNIRFAQQRNAKRAATQEENDQAIDAQLEKVMESLKATKESEGKYISMLEEAEKTCIEYKEKVDLSEKLHNIQTSSSPFDPQPPKLQVPSSIIKNRESAATDFADFSPISPQDQSELRTMLTTLMDHVDRLQIQIRDKDTEISVMSQNYEALKAEHEKMCLESEIQSQLLHKTKQDEIHIEELRTKIIDRESTIGEKSRALEQAERQLDCHKWLLEAEIRRNAALKLSGEVGNDALPDPTALTSKEEIDRWVDRLHKQLKSSKVKQNGEAADDSLGATVNGLRKEIEFYVREIIYYKLDVRGYKSDIKKLKKIVGSSDRSGRSGDILSPISQVSPTPFSPVQANLPANLAGHEPSVQQPPSLPPIRTDALPINMPTEQPITPDRSPEGEDTQTMSKITSLRVDLQRPMTPPNTNRLSLTDEAGNADPGISPRSNKKLSPERRKPTPPSPDQERFGDLATSFPLSTPASPKRHGAGMEDGNRSPGASEGPRTKTSEIPDRPPRPQIGLFESPAGVTTYAPRKDVIAEAMQHAPAPAPAPFHSSASTFPVTSFHDDTMSDAPRLDDQATLPLKHPKRPSTSSSVSSTYSIVPATTRVPSASCPITRNVKILPPSLRTGVGGTMASTTPTNSPISPGEAFNLPTNTVPGESSSSPPSRNNSSGSTNGNSKMGKAFSVASSVASSAATSSPRSRKAILASPSRAASSSSTSALKQAINLPARLEFMKGKGKSSPKKESIGPPTLLASPFDIDRSSVKVEVEVERLQDKSENDEFIGRAV